MSRCFPFPPPGYIPSRASSEALIESIKLQKENEKAKSDRKKEKKDKKEKKREKKEKKKSKEAEKAKQTKSSQLDHKVFKGEVFQKEKKDDTEQLERSSITEEHEQPSQNPSYSSDSTQNSGCKRKRQASPVNSARVGGNILRFRLPSQKNIKPDVKNVEQAIPLSSQKVTKQDIRGDQELPVRLPSENLWKFEIRGGEAQPSTSGRTDVLVEYNNNISRPVHGKSNSSFPAAEFRVNDDQLRSDQRGTQPNSMERASTPLEDVYIDSSSRRYKKMKKVAHKYKDLIENWTPPSMLMNDDDDNSEDWLFGRKTEATTRTDKISRAACTDTMMTCAGSSTLWPPRAHYLPEAEIYALPYTIPF